MTYLSFGDPNGHLHCKCDLSDTRDRSDTSSQRAKSNDNDPCQGAQASDDIKSSVHWMLSEVLRCRSCELPRKVREGSVGCSAQHQKKRVDAVELRAANLDQDEAMAGPLQAVQTLTSTGALLGGGSFFFSGCSARISASSTSFCVGGGSLFT